MNSSAFSPCCDINIFISKFCKNISLISRGTSSISHRHSRTRQCDRFDHWMLKGTGSGTPGAIFRWEEIRWLWPREHSPTIFFSSSLTTNAFDYFRRNGSKVCLTQRFLMFAYAVWQDALNAGYLICVDFSSLQSWDFFSCKWSVLSRTFHIRHISYIYCAFEFSELNTSIRKDTLTRGALQSRCPLHLV